MGNVEHSQVFETKNGYNVVASSEGSGLFTWYVHPTNDPKQEMHSDGGRSAQLRECVEMVSKWDDIT